MSVFGQDLILAMKEAVAHAEGSGPAILQIPIVYQEVRTTGKVEIDVDGTPTGDATLRAASNGSNDKDA